MAHERGAGRGEGMRREEIENCTLIEFLADRAVAHYVDAFGALGVSLLNERLRDLEVKMSVALASKLPSDVLDAALGRTSA